MSRFKRRFEYHDEGLSLIIPDEDIPEFMQLLESGSQVDYVRELREKLKRIIK